MEKYNHQSIEAKWQKHWAENNLYRTDLDGALNPFYNLMMFPYPSAEGLHIGGMSTFTGVDSFGRFKRMKGFDVFEPMGLDAFGIHSENYAIKIGEHIKTVSQRTEKHFYEQMHMMGNMFDWDHKLETNKEDYYKWTQWLFIQLFKAGLAYRKKATVNFCPTCKTVLSDEQVIDSKCERTGDVVEKRDLEQWFFRITKYADRLYKNLDKIDWDNQVRIGQRNWINKRDGINITYKVKDSDKSIVCFTTTPVNFGATFIVLSPEYKELGEIVKAEYKMAVDEYVLKAKFKTNEERLADNKEKTGVFTGSYVLNQVTGGYIPIWVADFVLANVGTGAVQGCPGHDLRDFDFAKKYSIPIKRVVVGEDNDVSEIDSRNKVIEKGAKGVMINSDFLNGVDFFEAMYKTMDYFEEKGWGKRVTSFNLRDWCVSRQRYWGPPIPMIYCEKCANEGKGWLKGDNEMKGWYPDENLPVKLPEIDSFEAIKPDGSGRGPLASQPDFVKTICPGCKSDARRETDVSDPFVDSCWYFLRYPFTDFSEIPFGGDFDNPKSMFKPKISGSAKKTSIARMKKWGPVSSYIGGKEHTVLHLLYARFVTMALHDLGYLDFEEPFTSFYGHGLITKDGAKMSKSKGNVINPDEFIAKYGADAVRLYLRFLGPFDQGGDWRDTGMMGMYRFVNKLWKIFSEDLAPKDNQKTKANDEESLIHKTIKEVGQDIEELRFNTAVAYIMEYVNWYQENKAYFSNAHIRKCLTVLALILAPLTPHIAEEFWSMLGNKTSVHIQKWPEFDESKTITDTVKVAVQVNGKFRGVIECNRGATEKNVRESAVQLPVVQKYVEKGIKKVIYVQDKVINFIIA